MSPFDVITVIIAKKNILLSTSAPILHISVLQCEMYYFISSNWCSQFWTSVLSGFVWVYFLYFIYFICGKQPHYQLHNQKVWRKSFRSEFHTLCRSPCRSSDTSMDKTIKWTFDKRLFCSVLLFWCEINPQAHIDVYIDLWQNKVKRVSTPDRCSFKFSIYLQKYTQQIQTEKKKTFSL